MKNIIIILLATIALIGCKKGDNKLSYTVRYAATIDSGKTDIITFKDDRDSIVNIYTPQTTFAYSFTVDHYPEHGRVYLKILASNARITAAIYVNDSMVAGGGTPSPSVVYGW